MEWGIPSKKLLRMSARRLNLKKDRRIPSVPNLIIVIRISVRPQRQSCKPTCFRGHPSKTMMGKKSS